jgi:murein DD-endopeptidase MepM/ murein hydrolase activator NlpD
MPRQEIGLRMAGSHEQPQARLTGMSHGQRQRATAQHHGRSAGSSTASPWLQAAFAAIAVLILGGSIAGFALASAPSMASDPTAADAIAGDVGGVGGVSTYGLPFVIGTSISISKGPHADNYVSVPGGYTFNGAGNIPAKAVMASIDLAAPFNTAVHPVASGRVLQAWPECHVVIVDHGNGVWTEYVHLQVSIANDVPVGRDSVLGTLLDRYDVGNPGCGDHSSGPHVHLAFISGSGKSGTYVPIAGRVLCGRTVDGAGNLIGLGSVGATKFIVPNCEASGEPVVTPTPKPIVTPTPKPVVTSPPIPKPVVTPAPKLVVTAAPPANAPASSCDAPSIGGPDAGSSQGSTQDVSLSWASNCAQTYAELSGAPYGILSFGGWQSTTSVHIGQMWPGTYSWHVKGKSASGQETSWSASRSFTIQSAAAPIVTNPPPPVVTPRPAPIVTNPPTAIITNPPAPIVTATPTPCPFKNGGNGVTFYTGANFTGQSWTWYVPAGNGDAYADLPSGLFRNLGSFYVSNNAWHVVLYQGENGTGNLGHYDASWANVDSYWHATESVKIYINRTC